jgi:hypothetical protein
LLNALDCQKALPADFEYYRNCNKRKIRARDIYKTLRLITKGEEIFYNKKKAKRYKRLKMPRQY